VRTGVFLQARLGSRRLPGKALLPLDGSTLLEAAMKALTLVPGEVHAVLTDRASAASFRGPARRCGFVVFEGPEEDVLERFCLAIGEFGVERVVRATGDNPLVSPAQARALLGLHEREGFDLGHFLGPPLGTGVEVAGAGALLESAARSSDPFEREHITTHMYRNRDRFRVSEPTAPARWVLTETPARVPDWEPTAARLHVSVDTQEDYLRVRRLFAAVYRGQPIETEEVVSWLRGEGR
jgi:spore coat polysaccharide biosynthesis protein SpsF